MSAEPATAEPPSTDGQAQHERPAPERPEIERGQHKKRPRKAARFPRVTGGTALLALLGLFVALVAVAVLSGNWQIRPVLSGSMRPGLPVGGVSITEKVPLADIKVRDVIVFHKPTNPAEMVSHRIITLRHTGSTYTVTTQGDANAVPDPWTLAMKGDTAYRVRYSLPLLGYPGVWVHNVGRTRLLMIGAGLVILLGVVSMWRKDRGDSPEPEPGDSRGSTGDETA